MATDALKILNQTKLDILRHDLLECKKCTLSDDGRSQVIFGCGKADSPDTMWVGEAPGAEEDAKGEPFLGRAGVLLMKMVNAMGYQREDVYLDNITKCRPLENRKPNTEECKTCGPHVEEQIQLILPRVLVCVGATSANHLLKNRDPMYALRGKWFEFKGIPTRVIYHPAYILRLQGEQEAAAKKETWMDLLAVKAMVEEVKKSANW